MTRRLRGLALLVAILLACREAPARPADSHDGAVTPPASGPDDLLAQAWERSARGQGLPQGLKRPARASLDRARDRCDPVLIDPTRPSVRLTRVRQVLHTQWSRTSTDTSWTTYLSRIPEGEYRVAPDTAYGLRPGQLLRVDCTRWQALTVVEPLPD